MGRRVAGAACSSMSFSVTSSGYFLRSSTTSKCSGSAESSRGVKSSRSTLALSFPLSMGPGLNLHLINPFPGFEHHDLSNWLCKWAQLEYL
jgi:hypothetical protein